MVKWCLRGFEVSDKYREQRHFRRLVLDNTVIGNISAVFCTADFATTARSSLLWGGTSRLVYISRPNQLALELHGSCSAAAGRSC